MAADVATQQTPSSTHQLMATLLGALATIQQRGPALPVAQQQELLAMARRQGIQLPPPARSTSSA